MHIGPGTQPFESTGPDAQAVEHASPTQEQMLQARETMGMIVDDAVYIRTYAQHGDFNVDGKPVLLPALYATKRGSRRDYRLSDQTAVRLILVDLAEGRVTHDLALDEGLTDSSPKIRYFDHSQGPDGGEIIRERPPHDPHAAGPTLMDVAMGRFPEFAEIAHTLRAISTQVAHEHGDRKWLHDHATGTQKIAYYNGLQRSAYKLGALASHIIKKPKR